MSTFGDEGFPGIDLALPQRNMVEPPVTNHHFSWKWHIFLSSASRSAKLFLTVTAREVLESGSLRSQVGVVSQGRTTNVPALKVETNLISQSASAPTPFLKLTTLKA